MASMVKSTLYCHSLFLLYVPLVCESVMVTMFLGETNGPLESNLPEMPSQDSQGACWSEGCEDALAPNFNIPPVLTNVPPASGRQRELSNPWDSPADDESCSLKLDEEKNDGNPRKILTNVAILQTEEELADFLLSGNLQLVVFYSSGMFGGLRESHRMTFLSFLNNFDEASRDLEEYSIFLALVNCTSLFNSGHCLEEKVGSFAFGFQHQIEKIAFPLETFYNTDSIVASALHLSLLYTVPIIQSLTERQNLENRCRNRCDIILSFQPSLGTKEHRLFLESSIAYKDAELVFALTTYAAGVYGLPLSPVHKKDAYDSDVAVYVLHCSGEGRYIAPTDDEGMKSSSKVDHGGGGDPCSVVSHFHDDLNVQDFPDFLRNLKLPLWYEIVVDPTEEKYRGWVTCSRHPEECQVMGSPKSPLNTPFDGVSLPWGVIIYDEETEDRVKRLVPRLAKLLRGFVAVLTINKSNLTPELMTYFRVTSDLLEMPTLFFFDPHQDSKEGSPFVSAFSDSYRWLLDQFASYRENKRQQDQRDDAGFVDNYLEPEELQQDDEMVREMVSEELLTNVVPIEGETDLKEALMHQGPVVIAFYISWDPISNMLLQHLHMAAESLRQVNSQASIHRLNCFNWAKICSQNQQESNPILKIWMDGEERLTYDGPIQEKSIVTSVLLVECQKDRTHLITETDLETFLSKGFSCPASRRVDSYIAHVCPSEKDSEEFAEVSKALFGYEMIASMKNEKLMLKRCSGIIYAVDKDDGTETISGCVIVSKPKDVFQPQLIIVLGRGSSQLHTRRIIAQIRHSSEPVFAQLDPRRLELGALVNYVQYENPQRQLSFILILAPIDEESEDPSSKHVKDADMTFEKIGNLAAKYSRLGIVFSYMEGSDEFRKEILKAYGLQEGVVHFVALDRVKGQVSKFDPSTSGSSEADLDSWIQNVINDSIEPSVLLPKGDWSPTMEGFDYLAYLEEDMLRESEEQLVSDMDFDFGQENARKAASKREN